MIPMTITKEELDEMGRREEETKEVNSGRQRIRLAKPFDIWKPAGIPLWVWILATMLPGLFMIGLVIFLFFLFY
jgi:hypothetical protein